MVLNKNIKIFINYFLGPTLFIWLSFSIYRQISAQKEVATSWLIIRKSFGSVKMFYLFIAVLLIPVNWGLEALKWKRSIGHLMNISFKHAFKAVLSGVSFSVTIPNRIGEYLGRVIYLPEGYRLKAVSATIVASFAQLLITLIAGCIGMLLLKNYLLVSIIPVLWYRFIIYGLTATTLLLLLLFFNIAGSVGWFNRWIKNQKYLYLVEALRDFSWPILIQLLFISLVRYLVFIIQYFLIFRLFNVDLPAGVIAEVMSVVFLFMAVVPSVALLEIGIRGEICLKLIGLFSANALGTGLTSVTVWLINLILPAIVGSLFLVNMNVFKRNNEVV